MRIPDFLYPILEFLKIAYSDRSINELAKKLYDGLGYDWTPEEQIRRLVPGTSWRRMGPALDELKKMPDVEFEGGISRRYRKI